MTDIIYSFIQPSRLFDANASLFDLSYPRKAGEPLHFATTTRGRGPVMGPNQRVLQERFSRISKLLELRSPLIIKNLKIL